MAVSRELNVIQLGSRHTLFLGFSHRDPEVSRIIEDVIFTAENKRPPSTIPGFYSLQFDILPLILGRDRVGKRSLESCPHPFLENSSIGLSVLPGHNTRVPTMLCFAPHGGTL